MKKTILAVMVAASAVLSAQALALNTAQVVINGKVTDAQNSCNVIPDSSSAAVKGVLSLDDITDATLDQLADNTLAAAYTKKVAWRVSDCQNGGVAATGLQVAFTGSHAVNANILDNEASDKALGVGLGMLKTGTSNRVTFDGTKVAQAYNGNPVVLAYDVSYVKLPGASIAGTSLTKGDVKGVATLTISY